jgi:hypothetical protein
VAIIYLLWVGATLNLFSKIHVVRIEPTRRLGFSQKTHVELAYTEMRIYWKSS